MNSPNYPPPGGQGPYGGPPQGAPYGQRPPQTPPGGQPVGGPPPQGPPFGGPPPQGQPFGGPGPGGPAGGFGPGPGGPAGPGGAPPAAYPTPPPAPAGKPKKSTFTIIKIVVGILVIAGGAIAYFVTRGSDPAASNVGDCIKVNVASTTNADIERIDCKSADAAYKVAHTSSNVSEDCPGGDESSYVSYTETRSRGSDTLLCLMLNVQEGDCIKQGTSADEIVDCTSPEATYKVIKVVTGSADPAGCPADTTVDGYIYTKPPTVQCFGDAKAGQT
jgi:hypothetical protein